MTIDAVVADANVLLSAAVGRAARRVFSRSSVTVHTTRFNADEVEEHLPKLAAMYGLADELVQIQWRLLRIRLHAEEDYAAFLDKARKDIQKRDPDDAHPLALARLLKAPLWSNDRDLTGHGVEVYSTVRLLKELNV